MEMIIHLDSDVFETVDKGFKNVEGRVNDEKRQKQIKNEIENSISELDSTRLEKEEIEKNFYEIESKRNKFLKSLGEVSIKKEEADIKIKNFDNSINTYLSEMRIKESKLKFCTNRRTKENVYIIYRK